MALIDRFKSLDPVIVGLMIALIIFGLVMLMSATGPLGVQHATDSLYYVKHQILSGILPGLVLFFFFAIIHYRTWRSFAFVALIASLILLVLVYLPGVGLEINGARSWIKLGLFSFQPSELVKLTFLLYLAAWLEQRQSLVPFLCSLGAVMLLLVLQPDTGSMVVIVGMALLLYYLSGAPTLWFAGLGALGVGFVGLMIKLSPYRAARFMTFLHPELDPKGIGYHINQAILAIGSGGFWGVGYGHSRQKFLYLPEVESDSVSAIIAEEMGFFVMAILLAVFAVLIWRCFKISKECPDKFGSFLAAGVGCMIAIQVLLNIGSMTGLLPMTGVTLPFVSHGGSAMTVLLGTMGLVAGIGRRVGTRNQELGSRRRIRKFVL